MEKQRRRQRPQQVHNVLDQRQQLLVAQVLFGNGEEPAPPGSHLLILGLVRSLPSRAALAGAYDTSNICDAQCIGEDGLAGKILAGVQVGVVLPGSR